MIKKFDSVQFQRKRRTELSDKLFKLSPKEVVGFFKKSSRATSVLKRKRTASV